MNVGNIEINIDIQNMNYVNTEINIDIHFNFNSQPCIYVFVYFNLFSYMYRVYMIYDIYENIRIVYKRLQP